MSGFQLLCAQILSTAYAMIMMAVIVGTALQLGEDGIGSPSAIFLISLSSSFFIAACLHPQEFWCIVPGIIYLLSIPSMYLLLILYSIINLNVVSWGTREVQVKKTKKVRAQPVEGQPDRSSPKLTRSTRPGESPWCNTRTGDAGLGKGEPSRAPRLVILNIRKIPVSSSQPVCV